MTHTLFKNLGRNFFALVFLCALAIPTVHAETFFGESPTGFLELDTYKDPVYLIVPDQYKPERSLPLVIALLGEGQKLKDYAEEWVGISKRKSMIVIVPSVKVFDSDVPYRVDEWLLRIQEDVMKRYRIIKDRRYLVGVGTGAHYAAYVGINYPEHFTGIGLMGRAWTGPFETIMKTEKQPALQVPAYAAFSVQDVDEAAKAQKKAEELSAKGYLVHVAKLDANEEYASIDLKKKMFEWLDEKSASWKQVVMEQKLTLRQKFNNWLKRNLSPK